MQASLKKNEGKKNNQGDPVGICHTKEVGMAYSLDQPCMHYQLNLDMRVITERIRV